MSEKENRRLSCEDGPPSPCSSDRSTPVSIEVDSPGPSRSPSPRRGDEYPRGGDGYPRGSDVYSVLYRRSPSPHQGGRDQKHTEGHSSGAYHEQSRARTPPPSGQARTSSTNPAPKLSFGISRILSDHEPSSKPKGSDSSTSLRNTSSPTSPYVKPTDLRVHNVLLPHPMHRGLSVVVPHPHHSHTSNWTSLPRRRGRTPSTPGSPPSTFRHRRLLLPSLWPPFLARSLLGCPGPTEHEYDVYYKYRRGDKGTRTQTYEPASGGGNVTHDVPLDAGQEGQTNRWVPLWYKINNLWENDAILNDCIHSLDAQVFICFNVPFKYI